MRRATNRDPTPARVRSRATPSGVAIEMRSSYDTTVNLDRFLPDATGVGRAATRSSARPRAGPSGSAPTGSAGSARSTGRRPPTSPWPGAGSRRPAVAALEDLVGRARHVVYATAPARVAAGLLRPRVLAAGAGAAGAAGRGRPPAVRAHARSPAWGVARPGRGRRPGAAAERAVGRAQARAPTSGSPPPSGRRSPPDLHQQHPGDAPRLRRRHLRSGCSPPPPSSSTAC